MKPELIEQIKNQGSKKLLLERASSFLFDLKMTAEDTSKEYYKDYKANIKKIRQLTDDIEQLINEAFKYNL